MADIPHDVLSDHIQQRMANRRPLAAAFLTYQFEPGFFEQDVLPLLFDVPLGQASVVRLLRLEEELRRMPGQVAVYYDVNGLIAADAAPKLDCRRIPIRQRTGIFHPKMVLILCEDVEADEDGYRAQSLLVACLSANLTRAGWWENIEACHVEVIEEGDRTRMREDLLQCLRHLRGSSAEGTDQTAIDHIARFLRRTESRGARSSGGVLHTHFYAGDGEPFTDFLERVAGSRLRGCYLEVLSPYFDKRPRSAVLDRLLDRFEPRETRVYLPRDAEGRVLVHEGLYASVSARPGVAWAHLPDGLMRLGQSSDAGHRFMHAKVYRFFRQNPKSEFLVVGSVNLTLPAHDRGGNYEAAFLVEYEPPRRPEFWLTPDTRRPTAFEPGSEDGDPATGRGVPLVVRFTWRTKRADAWWEGTEPSPALRLESNGVDLASLSPLPPREWQALPTEAALRLEDELTRTSFLTVHGYGKEPAVILVQEEGMPYKPPLMATLSAQDILEYWALLTPEQKQDFLESRLADILALGEGAEFIVRDTPPPPTDSMFDRFAGIFHAFDCMERAVREHLEKDSEREAEYRLFGRKHDSLGQLLSKVMDGDDMKDDAQRYVVLLCARQVRIEVARDFPDFWTAHRAEAKALDDLLARVANVRARLEQDPSKGMPEFLAWFEPWFLRRAKGQMSESPA